MTPQTALAFFLPTIAAGLVVLWMLHPPTGDASSIAFLASLVTLLVKMAADAVGYFSTTSSGSDKKTDAMVASMANGKEPSAAIVQPSTVVPTQVRSAPAAPTFPTAAKGP